MTAAPLRVAVIGAGRMAREHILAFRALPGVTVTGIASRTRSRAEALAREFDIALCAGSPRELYESAAPDLVVVAVSAPSAVEILADAIAYGAPILTEKPVGLGVADCAAVADLAREAGVRVWVGLNRRCYGATRAALADLDADPAPRLIEIHDQQDTAAARALGHDAAVIERWMFANSIHAIDYLRIFGRGDVAGVAVLDPWTPDDPALVAARIAFSGGDTGYYHAVWNRPGPWSCAVTTPERRWEMRPLEQARRQQAGSRIAIEAEPDPRDAEFKPGFLRQAEDVVAAIRDGGATALVPDIASALATTRLVARIYGMA